MPFYSGEDGLFSHLNHFGVKALPHFTATMSHQDRTIQIDVDQSSSLVERVPSWIPEGYQFGNQYS